MYKHNSFEYINNGNVSNIHLFEDGLHLLESGMRILAKNFTCKFNYFFRTQSLNLQILSKNRLKYPTNPLIDYLNINSLRNKIIDVRDVIGKLSLDYFVISETKSDESVPSAQFNISNYDIRN